MKCTDPGLLNTCRVLLSLVENGPQGLNQLVTSTELDKAVVQSAINNLVKKQKIRRQDEAKQLTGPTIYEYNIDYVPPERSQARKSRSKIPEARTTGKRVGVKYQGRYIDRKIRLLKSLLSKVGPDDRDVLIGIISDYQTWFPNRSNNT